MLNQKITRRSFLRMTALGAAASMISGMSALEYVTQVEPAWIETTNVRLALKRLSPAFAGLRLAQISDIHLGGWMNAERLDRVVQMVLDLRPDIVLLTGDYLLGRGWSPERAQLLEQEATSLYPLSKIAQVFSVLGNHDYWTYTPAVRSMLAKAGAIDLSNTVYSLTRGSEQLHLAGVDDIYERHQRLDLVLEMLPRHGAAILLAHEPDFADISAKTGRFDLQVSGHSHGGQVVIPFVGAPQLPKLGRKYPSGLYRVEEMYQYTNRGVGMGGIPVRFNCRPEITVFELAAG